MAAQAQTNGTDTRTLSVTLLGTGSPRPTLRRSQPATLVRRTGNKPILVDVGEGTLKQLMRAGMKPNELETILLTHLHYDHILGYPALIWGGWTLGLSRIEIFGPPGTKRMHNLVFRELFAEDVKYSFGIGFGADEIESLVVREIDVGDELNLHHMKISMAKGIHDFYNLAFRFDADGKVVVLSGDTTYSEDVVALAQGADLFICEVTLAPSPDYDNERGRRILNLLRKDHCTPAQAGQMAREANVGHLVVNHLIPGAQVDLITEGCAREFSGPITVGEDLMTFVV
jgi:ribonuclease Z